MRENCAVTVPAGEPYDWYQRGLELLAAGSAGAASLLLERAHRSEPEARSIREALARALFDAGRFELAAVHFEYIAKVDPVDDYAHYGLGMAMWRQGEIEQAREAFAIAAALRQDDRYLQALRQVTATLAIREETGWTPPAAEE
jgi:Flp pilus assembly protein TadD